MEAARYFVYVAVLCSVMANTGANNCGPSTELLARPGGPVDIPVEHTSYELHKGEETILTVTKSQLISRFPKDHVTRLDNGQAGIRINDISENDAGHFTVWSLNRDKCYFSFSVIVEATPPVSTSPATPPVPSSVEPLPVSTVPTSSAVTGVSLIVHQNTVFAEVGQSAVLPVSYKLSGPQAYLAIRWKRPPRDVYIAVGIGSNCSWEGRGGDHGCELLELFLLPEYERRAVFFFDNASLWIRDVRAEDAGSYQVSIQAMSGFILKEINLTVTEGRTGKADATILNAARMGVAALVFILVLMLVWKTRDRHTNSSLKGELEAEGPILQSYPEEHCNQGPRMRVEDPEKSGTSTGDLKPRRAI